MITRYFPVQQPVTTWATHCPFCLNRSRSLGLRALAASPAVASGAPGLQGGQASRRAGGLVGARGGPTAGRRGEGSPGGCPPFSGLPWAFSSFVPRTVPDHDYK